MYFSTSKLDLEDACPAAYKFKYLDKSPEIPTIPLIIGRAAHAAAARYVKHLLQNNLQTDVTAMPAIVAAAAAEEGIPGQAMSDLAAIMETFAESHVFYPARIVGVEERLPEGFNPPDTWPDPNLPNGHTFVGVIDLLEAEDNVAVITDYKTEWSIRSQSEVEKDPQLRRYCWLVHEAYPQFEHFKVRLDFIRHGVIREAEFDLAEVERTGEEILARVERILKTKEFPARPGVGCGWCSYSERCPARKMPAGDIMAKTNEELAGEILLLEKQLADRKEILANRLVTQGPLVLNGVEFGHHFTESKRFGDARAFMEVLQEAGKDPWDFLSVDTTKGKKLLRDEKLAPKLEALLIDASYTRFGHRKLKGDDAA